MGQVPNLVDDAGGLLVAVLGDEPARTLVKEGLHQEEDDVDEHAEDGEGVPVSHPLC